MIDSVTVPNSRVFDLHSEHAQADFQLRVAEPVQGLMPLPEGPRPVLYLLDANLLFGTAVEMTRLMSQLYGELPPFLVVGIAYDTDDPVLQAELRARDFTPTVEAGFEANARRVAGAREPTLPEGRRLGRASEFLDFLTDEVRPFVESRYDVAEGRSVVFGSSLGGLFTLHALLERPSTFDAYVAVSPALWWDDGHLLRRERVLAESQPDLHATLFLAVGANEETPAVPALAPFRMVSNLRTFAERLAERRHPSLRLDTWIAEGETHTSVVPVALTRGLRFVARGWSRMPTAGGDDPATNRTRRR